MNQVSFVSNPAVNIFLNLFIQMEYFFQWLHQRPIDTSSFTFEPYITIVLSVIYLIAVFIALLQMTYHILLNRYTRFKCGFRHFTRLGFSLCLFARLVLLIVSIIITLKGKPTGLEMKDGSSSNAAQNTVGSEYHHWQNASINYYIIDKLDFKLQNSFVNKDFTIGSHQLLNIATGIKTSNVSELLEVVPSSSPDSWQHAIIYGLWPISQLPYNLVTLSFIFCHVFLIFYWVSCYAKIRLKGKLHKNHFKLYCQITTVFLVSGIILYGALIGLHFAPNGLTTSMQVYKWIVLCGYFPILTLIISLGFSFFALKTFSDMSSMGSKTEFLYLRRIGIIIMSSLVVLYFKSIITAIVEIPEIATLFGLVNYNSGLWRFLILLFGECIPTLLMFFFVRSVSFNGLQRVLVQDQDSEAFIPKEVTEDSLNAALENVDDSTLFI